MTRESDRPIFRRSKRGCLTCRARRKKCPEDIQLRSDGVEACSACYRRRDICRQAKRKKGDDEASVVDDSSSSMRRMSSASSPHSITVSTPSAAAVAAGTLLNFHSGPSSVSGPAPVSGAMEPADHLMQERSLPHPPPPPDSIPADSPSSVLQTNFGFTLPSTSSAMQNFLSPPQSHPHQQQQHHPPPFQDQSVTGGSSNGGDPAWLDNFFEEILNLTRPNADSALMTMSPVATSSDQLLTGNDAELFINSASTQNGGHNAPSRGADWPIDRAVHFEDLDGLLNKCKHVYELYMCAIIDTSLPMGNGETTRPIMDHLMDITKSSNVCKASMVSCCLAYRNVVARQKSGEQAPSGFVKYLTRDRDRDRGQSYSKVENAGLSGSNTPLDRRGGTMAMDEVYATRFARAWLTYALKEFRQQRSMPLSARLLTLLNLRCACVCLLGAKESHGLALDIEAALQDLNVDVGYLQQTATSGTAVAFMTQALAAAHIMDVAAVRGMRCKIFDGSFPTPSPALAADDRDNPHATYKYVTSLSVDLLSCILSITNLAADIEEGKVTSRNVISSRSKAIEDRIVASELEVAQSPHHGMTRVRALVLHEMWRQAILIQLYQDVHNLGAMAAKVQSSLVQILELSRTVSTTGGTRATTPSTHPHLDEWDMSMVWFLAGTVAISEADRAICASNLESIGCERAILDNIEALRALWRHVDETGRADDWKSLLVKWRMTVCYTF